MGGELGHDHAGGIARSARSRLQRLEEHLLELLEVGARALRSLSAKACALPAASRVRLAVWASWAESASRPATTCRMLAGPGRSAPARLQQRLRASQHAIEHTWLACASRTGRSCRWPSAAASLAHALQVEPLLDRAPDLGLELGGGRLLVFCRHVFLLMWIVHLSTVLAQSGDAGKSGGEPGIRQAGALLR